MHKSFFYVKMKWAHERGDRGREGEKDREWVL